MLSWLLMLNVYVVQLANKKSMPGTTIKLKLNLLMPHLPVYYMYYPFNMFKEHVILWS